MDQEKKNNIDLVLASVNIDYLVNITPKSTSVYTNDYLIKTLCKLYRKLKM